MAPEPRQEQETENHPGIWGIREYQAVARLQKALYGVDFGHAVAMTITALGFLLYAGSLLHSKI